MKRMAQPVPRRKLAILVCQNKVTCLSGGHTLYGSDSMEYLPDNSIFLFLPGIKNEQLK